MKKLFTLLLLSTCALLQGQNLTVNQKLYPFTIGEKDRFGEFIAISGKYAVFTSQEVDNYKGAVFVFQNIAGLWLQMQKLEASDKSIYGRFGCAVDIHNDKIIVGSWGANSETGKAYIFQLQNNVWTETAILTASDGQQTDRFGYSVSIHDSIAVVGAPENYVGTVKSGSAYVFQLGQQGWSEVATLAGNDKLKDDEFGNQLENSDSIILVCSHTNGASAKGAVYSFEKVNGTWTQKQKIMSSKEASAEIFGSTASLDGNQLMIGAYGNAEKAWKSGATYYLEYENGSWVHKQQIFPQVSASDDRFGYAVSLSGDTALIGADWNSTDKYLGGTAYFFVKTNNVWTEVQKIAPSELEITDYFGSSVAYENGNFLIGAWADNDKGDDAGIVYSFTAPNSTSTLPTSNTSNFQFFPNPTSGEVNIVLEEAGQVRLLDINGKLILQENLKSGQQKLNTNNLTNGVYFLEINQGAKVLRSRVVVRK